jgi:hypothetical protein
VKEQDRFAKAFTTHVARFFAARELTAADRVAIEQSIPMFQLAAFNLTCGFDFSCKF